MLDAGLAVLAQVGLTALWGAYLWRETRIGVRTRGWARLLGQYAAPAALWVFFGVGGIVVLAYPLSAEQYYGVAFSGFSVLAVTLIAILGSFAYSWCFSKPFDYLVARPSRTRIERTWLAGDAMRWIVLGAFLVDIALRIRLISGGAHFAWLVDHVDTSIASGLDTDPLFQAQATLWPFVVAIATYLAFSTRRARWIPLMIVATEGLATVLSGQRRPVIVLALIVGTAAIVARPSSLRRVLVLGFVGGAAFALVLAPAMNTARYDIRDDAATFLRQPELITMKFLTEYLPAGLFRTDERTLQSPESQFWPRAAASMAFAASIHEQILDGEDLLTDRDLVTAAFQVVPRAIAPGKPSVDSDALVQLNLSFGSPGTDVSGTYLADALAHKYAIGVALMYAIGGILLGIGAGFMRRPSADLSAVMLAAGWGVFMPYGDSFAYYFASLRDYALVAGTLWLVIWVTHRRYGIRPIHRDEQPMLSGSSEDLGGRPVIW